MQEAADIAIDVLRRAERERATEQPRKGWFAAYCELSWLISSGSFVSIERIREHYGYPALKPYWSICIKHPPEGFDYWVEDENLVVAVEQACKLLGME